MTGLRGRGRGIEGIEIEIGTGMMGDSADTEVVAEVGEVDGVDGADGIEGGDTDEVGHRVRR